MAVSDERDLADELAAIAGLEAARWPEGPICPHCAEASRIYRLNGVKDAMGRVRHGLRKCGACRRQFTVRIGTLFEASHVPLHKWLDAARLLSAADINPHRLHQVLGVTYRTALMMSARLVAAMAEPAAHPYLAAMLRPTLEAPAFRSIARPIFVSGPGRPARRGLASPRETWWTRIAPTIPLPEPVWVAA